MSGRKKIRQNLKTAFANGLRNFTVRPLQVEVHGDIATDVGPEAIGFARAGGAAATVVQANYLVVWKKIDGQWLVHRDMLNARAPTSS